MRITILVLFVGLLGFLLGWSLPRTRAAAGPGAPVAAPAATPQALGTDSTRSDRGGAGLDTPAPVIARQDVRDDGDLISAALHRYAGVEMRRGWNEVRTDEMPLPTLEEGFQRFDVRLRALPRAIGRELAGQAVSREQLASDNALTVLKGMRDGSAGPQMELVQNRERFAKYFACPAGPRIDGAARLASVGSSARTPSPPGTVLQFPAGVFDLTGLDVILEDATGCIEVAGAGMEQTLFRLRAVIPREALDRFTVRDATVNSECGMIDLRLAGVLRAERVRFIGFDCGAGISSAFDAMEGTALECVDCRIEGGFGHSPSQGALLTATSPALLARFEDCTIDLVYVGPVGWPSGATVLFERCRFQRIRDAINPVDRHGPGIVFHDCSVDMQSYDGTLPPRRDPSELNPNW